MSLWVACNSCHTPFPAESHAGLVRCPTCADRMAYRIPSAGPTVTVVCA